jgi:hypothetical protein
MDRGIPTEEHLENMRARTISYLLGTPKGRLTKLEVRRSSGSASSGSE